MAGKSILGLRPGNKIAGEEPVAGDKKREGKSGTKSPETSFAIPERNNAGPEPERVERLFGGTGSAEPETGGGEYVTDTDGNVKRNKDGTPRKKRGRKAGGQNQPNITGLETLLFTTHAMLASLVKVDELALSAEESKQLANAISEVQSHYAVSIDPKTQAWIQLGIVGSVVYGPRLYAVRERRRARKIAPAQPRPQPPTEAKPERPPRRDDVEQAPKDGPQTPSEIYGNINPSDAPKL